MPKTNLNIRTKHLHDTDEDFSPHDSTPAERLNMVWEITQDAWAFFEAGKEIRKHLNDDEKGGPIGESSLSRGPIRILRRGC